MGFLNRIVHIENIRLKPIATVRVFTDDLYWSNPVTNSAEGASYNSHGCSPWLLKRNKFPGFGRKDANRENKGSPKRLDVFTT